MDILSFNGGNVEGGAEEWWIPFTLSAFDAFSHKPENPPANTLVLPLLMKALVCFTNRLHVPKAFGDYVMPK